MGESIIQLLSNTSFTVAAFTSITGIFASVFTYLAKVRTNTITKETKENFVNLEKSVGSVNTKIDKSIIATNENFKAIREDVDKLTQDTNSLKRDNAKKDALQETMKALNAVTTEAISFCDERDTDFIRFIQIKSEQTKDFTHNQMYINPDFNTVNIDNMLREADKVTAYINEKCCLLIDENFCKGLTTTLLPIISELEDEIREIIEDKINNKHRRFSIAMERFLQKNLSKTVREYNRWQLNH